MNKSKFFRIDIADLFKGLIMAVLTSVCGALGTIFNNGILPSLQDLQHIGLASLAVGCLYLMKNLFTNSEDKFLIPEANNKMPNKTLMIIGFMLISSMAFSAGDSVGVNAVKDSAAIANGIQAGVNAVIAVLPKTQGFGLFALLSGIFGGMITGAGIHWFGTRHGKKLK